MGERGPKMICNVVQEVASTQESVEQSQPEEPCPGGSGTGRMLYRAMREDPGGSPMVGPTARTLGVRPHVDIPVAAGQVRPYTGGMSVAPDRPENLHPLRCPAAYGGRGKDSVWYIRVDRLGADLQFRQDSPTHGLIEPARDMSWNDFQKSLERTKPFWTMLP
jgi:hypothetical protein